jgi:uncharacterized protein YjiS (DUF1127 family)
MTTFDAYAADHARPGLFDRLREALAERTAYLQVRAELSALSDRELADIGLGRYDIDAVARSAARS